MHHHHTHAVTGNLLRRAFFLTLIILAIEAVTGYFSNSLALLSDAGHILTDAFSLALAWFAARMATRPPNDRNTFGYMRTGILVALANAVTLIVVAGVIAIEAAFRIQHSQHVTATPVIVAALVAIGVNAYIAFGLRAERRENLNVRAAFLHIIGDLAASVGVVVAGVIILIWHAYLADPLLSLGIAMLIALGAWNIVRDTVTILMESTPRGIDLDRVRDAMLEIPGVEDVHDLHVWAVSDGMRMMSVHASVHDQPLADTAMLLDDVKMLLHRRFHIDHATIEVECVDCRSTRKRPVEFVPRVESRLPKAE
ncbi:MAG: cation diffusion facilitator family transporter [Chloroflexota bacterium]